MPMSTHESMLVPSSSPDVRSGVATPDVPLVESASGYELPVTVIVKNDAGEAVFRASIAMWVSPRK